jgi:Ca2+:H+ antiporter
MSSVKPFSYICAVFLVLSYVIGLWFSLRTHAAQIWEVPTHAEDTHPLHHQSSLANWRNNIPDEPFLKRIGERMVSGGHQSSSAVERADPPVNGTAKATRSSQEPRLSSAFTAEDNAMLVRNVAEVAAAAATLAVHNSQVDSTTATPQVTNSRTTKRYTRLGSCGFSSGGLRWWTRRAKLVTYKK